MTIGTLYVGFARVVQHFSLPPTLGHHPTLQARQLQQSSSKVHINPSVLIIIIILSVLFICSGVLHILARCLGLRRARPAAGGFISPSISIRGQLQHLFSQHDSGVEQVVIDTLPTFLYGSIRGLKDSADCAVCLIEFVNEDRLRLLPKCKHAFHSDCIDTWLLSNSTCPLCRRSLLPEEESAATPVDGNAPALSSEDSQGTSRSQRHGSFRGSSHMNLRSSFRFLTDVMAPSSSLPSSETDLTPIILNPAVVDEIQASPMSPGPTVCVTERGGSEKVLRVELGKVNNDPRKIARDMDNSLGPRSYSMGSYEYVVSLTRLGIATPSKPTHKTSLSDTIPDCVSSTYAPGQEDMFPARRDSDSPHRLSMVMETMTPSPQWLSSPSGNESQTSLSRLQQHELATTPVSQLVPNTAHNEHQDSTTHGDDRGMYH